MCSNCWLWDNLKFKFSSHFNSHCCHMEVRNFNYTKQYLLCPLLFIYYTHFMIYVTSDDRICMFKADVQLVNYTCDSNLSIALDHIITYNWLIQHCSSLAEWSVGLSSFHQWKLFCDFGRFLCVSTSYCLWYSFLCIVLTFFYKYKWLPLFRSQNWMTAC
jgi:hypothetical protein